MAMLAADRHPSDTASIHPVFHMYVYVTAEVSYGSVSTLAVMRMQMR